MGLFCQGEVGAGGVGAGVGMFFLSFSFPSARIDLVTLFG